MTIAKYYDLETQKVIADGELVALFTDHGPTLGTFREARLRSYVKQHVAHRYQVSSGFISDYDSGSSHIRSRSSKQLDCLIYDPTKHAPLIECDTFVAIMSIDVGAFIEVKSDLKLFKEKRRSGAPDTNYPFDENGVGYRWAGTLVDALANVLSGVTIMKAARVEREKYFAGIISYDGDGLNQLPDALVSGQLATQLSIKDIDDLPDSICVLTRGWWGVSAYQWFDGDAPEPEDLHYDPENSVLLSATGSDLKGTPLQLMTALLSHTLEFGPGEYRKKIGGLRSAVGRQLEIKNTRFPLPCPGKG